MTAEHTHRDHARYIRAKLAEQLETLKLLERNLGRRPDHNLHELIGAEMVAVAISHVQQAIDLLEIAACDFDDPDYCP